MEKTFAQRLQILIDSKKISQLDLANGVGVSGPMVTNWLNGKTKSVRRTTLQKLSAFFGCNIEWLASGEGEMFPPHRDRRQTKQVLTGNGNIQAGGRISGATTMGQQPPGLILDGDEQELILKLRDFGGKKMIQKFLKELEALEKLIDGQ